MIQNLNYIAPFSDIHEQRLFRRAEKLFNEEDFAQAAVLWEQLLVLYPIEAMLHFVLGRCRHMQRAAREAEAYYLKAIEFNPEFWQAYFYMGSLLVEQAQYREAIEVFYYLLQRQPNDSNAWALLGGALSKLGEHAQAIECCLQALRLNPQDSAALYNLSFAYAYSGNFTGAMDAIDAALVLDPAVPIMHMHRAALLLRTGRYDEGWPEWEWRLQKDDFRALNVRSSLPQMWQGEALTGKTLLVWCEQGFGDTLQFVRYLRLAKECGARVLFECQLELIPIVAAVDGADRIFPRFADCPESFDYHAALTSLPLWFHTTLQNIPSADGYLSYETTEGAQVRVAILPDSPAIGLAWEGSRLNPANHYRSCTPQAFAPLLALTGCTFYGLQHELRDTVLPAQITHLGVTTMTALAAAIASLDLVITIDTSVAHLAGAMGKEVWLLLSALPDWRWGLEGETTPWYASMHIVRQKTLGDWTSVMNETAELLRSRITCAQLHQS